MPELPEVETVRRGLAERSAGSVVRECRFGHPGILEESPAAVEGRLVGARIERFDRIGKYLLARFSRDGERGTLVFHLGMSGQLLFQAPGEAVVEGTVRTVSGYVKTLGPHVPDRHTHLVLECRGGGRFLFRDPRRFGRILLLRGWEDAGHPRLDRLGPDALSLDADALAARLRGRGGSRIAKVVLLDQAVVAGVGNIYADEACFEAGIAPDARIADLSGPRLSRLARAVASVLERGVRNAGTTFRDFVGSDGERGGNAEQLMVYGRGGEPCRRCGAVLRSARLAGRGTVFCPKCQRGGGRVTRRGA